MSDVNVNIHNVEKITLKGKLIPNGCDDETFKVLDIKVHRKDGQTDTISLFCEQDIHFINAGDQGNYLIHWVKN